MAARQLSPTTIGALLAGVFTLLVLAYMAFLFLGTNAAPVAEASHTYDTQVLATELNSDNDQSIFLLTVPLLTPTGQTSGNIQYSPDELGKTDITQRER